jgi:hypothetical protein
VSVLPGFVVGRGGIKLALEGNHREFEDSVHQQLTPGTSSVLVWAPPDEEIVVWLKSTNLSDWLTDEGEAMQLARDGLDRLLAGVEVDLQIVDRIHTVALLKTDSIFKASLLLAPSLRSKVEPHFGWPVCAIAPCRDFLMLFRDGDDELIPKLAGMVAHEYEGDPNHSLTVEVLRTLDDGGIEAIGSFAEVLG